MTSFEEIILPQDNETTTANGTVHTVNGNLTAESGINVQNGTSVKTPNTAQTASTIAKSAEPAKPDWATILAPVTTGTKVTHKTFGQGTVTKLDKTLKYLTVSFAAGQKNFVFPNAFIDGFLKL